VYVGQTEQRKSEVLRNISNFDVLPQGHVLNKFDKGKIEQIDCLWLDKDDDIVYAFEVETSTTVKSGLERFLSLLKANYTQCLTSGAMVVIIPDDASRINVLKRELQDGTFAGAPFYMNKKTKFCFLDSIREDVANIEVFAKEFKEI